MRRCDECGYNVINSIKLNTKTICFNCHFKLSMANNKECAEAQTCLLCGVGVIIKTLCTDCHYDLLMTNKFDCVECGCKANKVPLEYRNGDVCNKVFDVCKRVEFNDKLMCDLCWDEACSNALNNGPGDSIIDTKAFNEIKNINLRNK